MLWYIFFSCYNLFFNQRMFKKKNDVAAFCAYYMWDFKLI